MAGSCSWREDPITGDYVLQRHDCTGACQCAPPNHGDTVAPSGNANTKTSASGETVSEFSMKRTPGPGHTGQTPCLEGDQPGTGDADLVFISFIWKDPSGSSKVGGWGRYVHLQSAADGKAWRLTTDGVTAAGFAVEPLGDATVDPKKQPALRGKPAEVPAIDGQKISWDLSDVVVHYQNGFLTIDPKNMHAWPLANLVIYPDSERRIAIYVP